jgi:Tfp pilus assembly PilM family ATPase/Tfp pilus assembly protein PilN
MAKRAIGVDITPAGVFAAQLVKRGDAVRCERVYSKELAEAPQKEGGSEQTAGALKALMQEGEFRTDVPVGVSMPAGSVFFQNLETDLPSLDHVRQVIGFELEDDLPVAPDQLVIDVCAAHRRTDRNWYLLIGAVRKAALEERMALHSQAGIECDVVDAEVCALHAAVARNHPDVAEGRYALIHTGETNTIMAISEGGQLLTARDFPHPRQAGGEAASDEEARESASRLLQEIRLTWQGAFGGALSSDAKVVLGGRRETAAYLAELIKEHLECEVTVFDPFARIACADQVRGDGAYGKALGLALRAMNEGVGGMNFLAVDKLKARRATGIKRALVVLGILIGAVVAVWGTHLVLQLRDLQEQNRRLKTEMREAFLAALPEEQHIVNEEKQLQLLEEHLEDLQKEREAVASVAPGTVTPLQVLQYISSAVPERMDVKISDLSITGQSVRLRGTTDSFSSVDELRSRFGRIPGFVNVETGPVDVGRSEDEIRFTIYITVEQG